MINKQVSIKKARISAGSTDSVNQYINTSHYEIEIHNEDVVLRNNLRIRVTSHPHFQRFLRLYNYNGVAIDLQFYLFSNGDYLLWNIICLLHFDLICTITLLTSKTVPQFSVLTDFVTLTACPA